LQRVIFDSSFLMAVAENPTTWFEDIVEQAGMIEPLLLECVREELEMMASDQGRKGRLARVSLEIASSFTEAPCGKGKVDDEIASAAATLSAFVATTDRKLFDSLKGSHVKVIRLRKGRTSLD
jgi:rRNA-processing protein FCF1